MDRSFSILMEDYHPMVLSLSQYYIERYTLGRGPCPRNICCSTSVFRQF